MPLTASRLRADIYRILDRVLETGVPVEIERKGRMLRIVADTAPSKLANLTRRPYLAGDPEELVEMDWSESWDADRAADPGGSPPPTAGSGEDTGAGG